MATVTVRRCADWRRIVTTQLLSSSAGDVLVVDDYEMMAYANQIVHQRALGVRVLVDAPPVGERSAWVGQDDFDFD